jgi:hypothetical protein
MIFDWRKFLNILVISGLASFITLLLVQYFQGHFDPIMLTAGKAGIIGFGFALLFSIQRRKKGYPWME